jgi:tetratricopeptide (TPR) repeat protein
VAGFRLLALHSHPKQNRREEQMRNNRAKILEQLRQAREQGVLDEESYRAAVANLEADSGVQAEVEGSGAVAQEDGTAATTGSVSVRGDVGGSIAVNYHAAERAGTSPDHPEVRHNLPQPDYGKFVGRQEELTQVHRILRPYPHSRHPLVTIDGIGGIGKSALALEAAHHYLRDYDRLPEEERFEAIIWTSAKSEVLTADGIAPRRQITRTLDDIYTAIAVALEREDITRARPEEQDDLVTKALTRQRTLLIVDNLETVDDERVNGFLRELPAPTKAIVTTRHRIDVAYPIRLTGMPEDDALDLIAQECEKKDVTLTDAEAEKLYRRTGGVPLAVVWSVAQMGYGYGVESVLRRLGEPTGDIARFCFEGAMERIRGKPAHKLLMALTLFATNASREALGYVADLSTVDRDEGLVLLERLSLVSKEDGRFWMLPLTQTFVQEEMKHFPLSSSLQENWLSYWYESIMGATRESTLYRRIDDLLRLFQALRERGKWSEYFDVWTKVSMEWVEAGHWEPFLFEYDEAIAAATEIQDRQAVSETLYRRSALAYYREQYKQSYQLLLQAHAHLDHESDPDLRIRITESLGQILMKMDRHRESLSYLQEARSERERHDRSMWHSFWALGECYEGLNQMHKAEEYLQRSLDLAEERGPVFIVDTLLSIGRFYLNWDKLDLAEDNLLRSHQLASKLNRMPSYAESSHLLAKVYTLAEDEESALHFLTLARDAYSELGRDELVMRIGQEIEQFE